MELWKVGEMQSYFPTGQFRASELLASQYSKYTAMLSKFSFPKKGNKNKSNFRLVNLCNGGTKDFVKPVQTTTSVKRPMLSPPKQIPVTSLLFNATSDQFFDSKMKKNLSKTTTTKLYPAKECGKNIRNYS